MPKPEFEFFSPDHLPWTSVVGSAAAGAGGAGVDQKMLSHDPDTGDSTRLVRFAGGYQSCETITHDCWEEVWILEGEITDLAKQQTFRRGMYACRPPGMVHGPYRVVNGCLMLEIRYTKQ